MGAISDRETCTGCRACELICPVHCISMKEDSEGFLYPIIEHEICVNCGKCGEICFSKISDLKNSGTDRQVFAAWNKNTEILKKSSSGGIFYSLAKYVLRRKGIVYGAAFTKDFFVEQTRIDREKDITLLMGSKYVQSDTKRTYAQTLEDLKNGKIVMYSGTPCQIRGLINFVGEFSRRLYCVSVICHGAPSPRIWKKYLHLKKGQYDETRIQSISFRDKTFGWKDFCININFEKQKYLEEHNYDLYMQGFLQNLFLRPSCYQCIAKKKSVYADIILGDYWGIEKEIPELNQNKGISSVIINTKKGIELWDGIQDEINSQKSTYESVAAHNNAIKESVPDHRNRSRFYEELDIGGVLEEAIKDNLNTLRISNEQRYIYQYSIVYKYLKRQLSNNDIKKTIHRLGLKKIVLYAITDLLDLLLIDIERKAGEFTIYVSDRNYKKYGEEYKGTSMICPYDLNEMEKRGEVDGVIICNPLRENDIFKELMESGIRLEKIYSLTALIFD